MLTLVMRSKLSVCSIYFLFFHVKYALQYPFVCEKLENVLGGGASPSPDPTPVGFYGAALFAPLALMLGAFDLHPRTLAQGEVEVGGGH